MHRLAIAVLAVVLSGCAATDSGIASTVGVRAAGCESIDRFGTGVVVSGPDGPVVVTSAHTVTGATSITVVAGHEHPVELVAFDPASDLALLSAPEGPTPASVARTIDRGEPGRLIVWEPDGRFIETEVEVRRLLRVTIEDIFVELEVQRLAFEINSTTTRGDSGAPVFNDKGQRPGSHLCTVTGTTGLVRCALRGDHGAHADADDPAFGEPLPLSLISRPVR